MAHTTHSARVAGPVNYLGADGKNAFIPLGPCLVEQLDGRTVDISWGESGDRTAALTFGDLEMAENFGYLIVLD